MGGTFVDAQVLTAGLRASSASFEIRMCLQVVMEVAPEYMLEQIHHNFLRGSLATLAMHPCANYSVQAYLAALQTPQQVPIPGSLYPSRGVHERCNAGNSSRMYSL